MASTEMKSSGRSSASTRGRASRSYRPFGTRFGALPLRAALATLPLATLPLATLPLATLPLATALAVSALESPARAQTPSSSTPATAPAAPAASGEPANPATHAAPAAHTASAAHAAPSTSPTPSAVQRADAAFEEGRALFEHGDFKQACEKFELSLQLDPSPGTLLNLGNCYEPQGDLVRALESFERAFADAQNSSDMRRKELWTDASRERIASLSRRVPQLSVRGVPANGRVSIDHRPLERTSGVSRINPGRHTIEVSAPGKSPFTLQFDIESGQRMAINVPALEAAPAAAPRAAAPSRQTSQPSDGASNGYGPWPYVLGGAGAVLLGTSLITGLTASSKQKKLERECPVPAECDPSLESTLDSAKTLALWTDVLWITGAVAAAAGVTLFVLDANGESTTVQAGCFEAGCGLLAHGHF